jgi:hypothetical protein
VNHFKEAMMSHYRILQILLLLTMGILAGCLNITNIEQPTEVKAGGDVAIVISCTPQENSGQYVGSLYWGFLGVYVPDDWTLIEARVDSPIKALLKENERIAVLMDLATATQSGYKWIGLLTEKQLQFTEKMLTEPVKLKLKFTAGNRTGQFALNYHLGLSDSDVVTLSGINWGNDLGPQAIEVNP